jgi:hypothetical protein
MIDIIPAEVKALVPERIKGPVRGWLQSGTRAVHQRFFPPFDYYGARNDAISEIISDTRQISDFSQEWMSASSSIRGFFHV